METKKTVKQYAKEAKTRLKHGFWQDYHKNLEGEIEKAKQAGVSESKVIDFYTTQIKENIKVTETNEEDFYKKVKKLLDEEGEISNALGFLTDIKVYNSLSYEDKQRYNLNLSERYLKAVERYKKEKAMQF